MTYSEMSSLLLSLSPAKRGSQGLETKHLITFTPTLFRHPYLDLLILRLVPSTGSYTPATPHLPASLQPLDSLVLCLIEKFYLLATSRHSHSLGSIHLTHSPTGKLCGTPLSASHPLTGLSLCWPCQSLALDMYFLAFSALVPASPA